MIKCIILEDEELAAKSLIKILSGIESIEIKGHYFNPVDAQNKVNFSDIDLIFLDVEMPEISGLDFIKSLSNPPRVIVTTARSDFAIGAFEINAVDFILKPVTISAVLSALQKFNELEYPEVRETLSPEAESIFIKVDTNLVRLKFDEILWMEALGDYVGFHTSEKRYVVKVTLAYIEKRIAKKNFTRVHRSFMVNTDKIKMIDDSSLVINDKLIPISRGSRAGLMESINLLK
ncbi:MAG: DNA-binding LytR/AlgR family response regulator [Bacteroidia bacterium]|jgi:DNA-binding LytR/AlgR family response regulator